LSSSGVFVLGLFSSKEIVGYYSAIEKLVKAFVSLFLLLTQTIIPYSSKKLKENKQNGLIFIIKTGFAIVLIALSIAIFLTIFSKQIILLIFGINFAKYNIIMYFLAIWLLFGVLNNFIGIQFLIGSTNSNTYSKSFSCATAITLIIYFGLTWKYSYMAIVLGMVLGEITLTVCMIYFIRRYKLWL
jgi:PST family polysaccharide transporter